MLKIKKVWRRIHKIIISTYLGLVYIPPNYAFIPKFHPGQAVIDIGTGDDPDFSLYMIQKYGLVSYAVDPTRKHAGALSNFDRRVKGFHFLPFAIGGKEGITTFFESTQNMSGSLLPDHKNIHSDITVHYDVEVHSLASLLSKIHLPRIALMKVDIEGEEYDFIQSIEKPELSRISQIIVEFHHGTIASKTWADTQDAISKINKLGMKSFVYNGRDCLFYW